MRRWALCGFCQLHFIKMDAARIGEADSNTAGGVWKNASLATVALTGAYSALTGAPSLATVATTGAYSDLTGKPTLGSLAALSTVNNSNWSGTALAIGNGGTGQTTASTAFDALSPMTTLGDVIYGGASGTNTRLAGNTTTTKKFFTQTGNGSVSAAPGWNVIVAGDVPTLNQNTTGLAGTATALATGRTINGTTFDGTANITVTAAAGTLTGTTLNATVVTSSLAALGTITTGVWNGTTIALANGGTASTTALAARSSTGLNIEGATSHGDSIYTILATDRVVYPTALTASRVWTLPAASSVNAGGTITVADIDGVVTSSNTIVVTRAGSDTINGANTFTLNAAYQGATLTSDGSSKWLVSNINIAQMPAFTGGNVTSSAGSGTLTIGAAQVTNAMLAGSIAASNLIGSDIATVGTITTGLWHGTVVGSTYGGTGVNNGASTITLAGNLVTSGANSLTLTTTGSTNVTLPTSGTLVNTAVATLSSLTSIGTIATGTWAGTTIALNHGGTGQTTANASFNALSPMTTVGDTIYGAASGVGTRLAGNTTTTTQFLQSTGSGSAATAPVWGGINAAINVTGMAYIDPRNPKYGANTCTGYYPATAITVNVGGAGYAVNDTFNILSGILSQVATAKVTSVSGGVVTGIQLLTGGGGFIAGYVFTTVHTSGAGNDALTVNVTTVGTGNDDTAAFAAAAIDAVAAGIPLLMPHGAWVSNLILPNFTNLCGFCESPTYGYDVLTEPVMYVWGTPTYGININGASNQAFVGFTLYSYNYLAGCGIGTTLGNTDGGFSFGAKTWLRNMSIKQFNVGFGSTDGTGNYIFAVTQSCDFGANNIGVYGPVSDWLSIGDTFVSNTTCIQFTTSSGGSARVVAPRIEYSGTGVISPNGDAQSTFTSCQFDRITGAAFVIGGGNQLHVFGGTIQAAGTGGTLKITGAANNGSGLIRLTVTAASGSLANVVTGDKIRITGVTGVTNANGYWTLTKIDTSHIDLQSSTFAGTFSGTAGRGFIDGKSCSILVNDNNNQYDLHIENVGFYGMSDGAIKPPGYIIDYANGCNFDYISIRGGSERLSNDADPAVGYQYAFANWVGTQPAHVIFDVQGSNGLVTGTETKTIGIVQNYTAQQNFGAATYSLDSRVASDFSKTSSTAVTAITGLTATLGAGLTYKFEIDGYMTCAAAGGVQMDLNGGSATATNIICEAILYDNSAVKSTTRTGALATSLFSTTTTGTTDIYAKVTGTITVNAGGTFIPRFAQNTSNGTASVVKQGSTMTIRQLL